MKFAAPISRSVGMALVLAFLGSASAHGQNRGTSVVTVTVSTSNAASPAKKDDALSKVPLAPEVQKKLDALIDKMKTARGEYWQGQMDKEVDRLTKDTGLADQGRQALQAASKQAVADSMKAWMPKIPDDALRQLTSLPKAQVLSQLDQALTMINQP